MTKDTALVLQLRPDTTIPKKKRESKKKMRVGADQARYTCRLRLKGGSPGPGRNALKAEVKLGDI